MFCCYKTTDTAVTINQSLTSIKRKISSKTVSHGCEKYLCCIVIVRSPFRLVVMLCWMLWFAFKICIPRVCYELLVLLQSSLREKHLYCHCGSRSVGGCSSAVEAAKDSVPAEYKCLICGLHIVNFTGTVFPSHLAGLFFISMF